MQVVEFLLQCGFSVSSRNNEGKTPLHTAALKVIIIMITNNNIKVIIIMITNNNNNNINKGKVRRRKR